MIPQEATESSDVSGVFGESAADLTYTHRKELSACEEFSGVCQRSVLTRFIPELNLEPN